MLHILAYKGDIVTSLSGMEGMDGDLGGSAEFGFQRISEPEGRRRSPQGMTEFV